MAEILPLQADDIEHKDAKPTPKSTEKMDDAQKKVEGESRPPGTVLKNGIILGPDGKPCKQCNSLRDLLAFNKKVPKAQSSSTTSESSSTSAYSSATTLTTASAIAAPGLMPSELPTDCPPDVETLGRSTWTLLHSLAATYPPIASTSQQAEMQTFLSIFSRIYPCWFCAADFQKWMSGNQPKLGGRDEFGDWMCRAHNAVNRKLGKKEFDCRFWEERWREAKDGRCG